MPRTVLAIGFLFVAALGATACGSSGSKISTPTSASAGGSKTTTANGGGVSGGGAMSVADLCKIISPEVVQAQTGTGVTRAPDNSACQYNGGPNGLFLTVSAAKLNGSGKDSFDTYVKGSESGTTEPVAGLGDGAVSAQHDVNTTTYAYKGDKVVAVTVFEDPAKAKTDGKALADKALSSL